jgi:arylsulfatase A-like enzyme
MRSLSGLLVGPLLLIGCFASAAERPNIVLIYADDVGYGDVSCYGATAVETPAIDRMAKEGLRFTDAHSASATCTPSRYAMLTGEYAWRQKGTGIARGDANLIIPPGTVTLASILKQAGYRTGVVGKWHLGLGQGGPGQGKVDWNETISPGPEAIGFDYSFLIPATGDRVPTVYTENGRVVGLDPNDPIRVSYDGKIGDEPTGAARPDLLTMNHSHGHDNTIVNGIGRIGFMTGGHAARWKDEEMADRITEKAVAFVEEASKEPFFLFFSLHDIHVPRAPHERFVGKTNMGPRGDAIVQMDWCIEQILETLDRLGMAENTIVLFGSDNGPVIDDGYQDQAVTKLGDHRPAGPFRGGKYSAFEGGTRTPLIVRWPAQVKAGSTSDALVCQVDFPASFASLVDVELPAAAAPDSFDVLPALLGRSEQGRQTLVEHAGSLGFRDGDWKLIVASKGPKRNASTNTELGNDSAPQLYDLSQDVGETKNVAADHPERVQSMLAALEAIRNAKGSRPGFEAEGK